MVPRFEKGRYVRCVEGGDGSHERNQLTACRTRMGVGEVLLSLYSRKILNTVRVVHTRWVLRVGCCSFAWLCKWLGIRDIVGSSAQFAVQQFADAVAVAVAYARRRKM